MLTKQQIEDNRKTFISILRSVDRAGCDVEALINKLDSTGFFYSPASTKWHSNFEGGLCLHSLNVYNTLLTLVKQWYTNEITDNGGTRFLREGDFHSIDSNSIIITGLLHDVCKMNFYEQYFRNEKKYSATGSKHDEQGNFDWVSKSDYKIKASNERFLYSTHGHNSEYIVGTYIPLTFEESVAIVNHMGKTSEVDLTDQSAIYSAHPLATLLHAADYISTFLLEVVE